MTPEITHLQFAVLHRVAGGVSGRKLREELADLGFKMSRPAFYQLMARLENTGLVEGKFKPKTVGGYRIREKHYEITGEGESAVASVHRFYARLQGGLQGA